jgi:hypothetical protein
MNINKNKIYDKLVNSFIGYQYRLENPFPQPNENYDLMLFKFKSDYIFNAKVKSLACGVMHVIDEEISKQERSHE